ncbi:hypothetical protein ACGFJ7_24430 [Actinoplanes sp. NPDC048988]|uniref:hypothetical protein n=1 Tax=Actinoplanes sp. NPDC048988 TaxID=3363901 RepID=UPI00371C6FD7
MSVDFGVFVPQGWKMDLVEIADPEEQYEAMTAVARVADAGPWDSIWLYDHFHTWPEPSMNTTFECWTVKVSQHCYAAGHAGSRRDQAVP